MVNVYIKERINDQKTICAGGVTSNTTYLGNKVTISIPNKLADQKDHGLGNEIAREFTWSVEVL